MAKDAEGKKGKKSKEEDLADRRRHQAMRHRGMRRDDKRPSSGDGGGGCPSFTCTAARCEGLGGRGRWVPRRGDPTLLTCTALPCKGIAAVGSSGR